MLLDNLSSLTGTGWLLLLVAAAATIFPIVKFLRGGKMSREEKRVNLFCSAAGFVGLVLFVIYLATDETTLLTLGGLALVVSVGTGRFFKRRVSASSSVSAEPKPKDDELANGPVDDKAEGGSSRKLHSSDRRWELKVNLMFGLLFFAVLAGTVVMVAGPLMFPQGTMTYEEVNASPHKVVERDDLDFDGTKFTYVNPDGDEVPLSAVCGDGLTAKPCVSSEDGSVRFYYGADRSGLNLESEIVIGGEVMPSECHFPSGILPSGWVGKVCAPLPAVG